MEGYVDLVAVPRGSVRFPLELEPPAGFRPEDPATWPRVPGRLEWVGGKLWFMPPCGSKQMYVATDSTLVLGNWAADRPEFIVGSNEAGMHLGGDVRGAEGAVWRREDLGGPAGGFEHVVPILAVEVTGQEEDAEALRQKAAWYLGRGVANVWIVLCDSGEVLAMTREGERRYGRGERIAEHPALAGLCPLVDRFFETLDRRQ